MFHRTLMGQKVYKENNIHKNIQPLTISNNITLHAFMSLIYAAIRYLCHSSKSLIPSCYKDWRN